MLARWSILLVLLLGLLSPRPAQAASPTETMETFFEQANALLRGAGRTRGVEETRQGIRQLVNDMIEFREAAAHALGPVWSSRSSEDQNEFIELFSGVLERGFVAALVTKASVVGGVKITFLGETETGDQAIVATTLLGRNGTDVPVEYRLVRRSGRWKIQDVIIEDISLIANYRAQFSRILRDHPYMGLVARMKGETPEASTSEATADSQSVSWPRWIIGHMGDERGAAEPSLPVRMERD
jgi:phospholipid transport system substrate-binding protein